MRIGHTLVGAALTAVAVATVAAPAIAAPAGLDPGFGNGGIVTTTFPGGRSSGSGVTVDSQGRIVVAGQGGSSPGQIAVARYRPDGTLDPSFGAGTGRVTTPVGNNGASGIAVAVQNDGKIVVAGLAFVATGTAVVVARYNDNGTLDTGFNGTGVFTSAAAGREADAVLVQPDGKIVVGASGQSTGSGSPAGMVLVRLTAGGTLDSTFDGDGVAHVWNDAGLCGASDQSGTNGIVRLPNGDLLSGGECGGNPQGTQAIGVARFHGGTTPADGALDTTFGTNGARTNQPEPGTPAFGTNIALQSDGKVVQGGSSQFGNGGNQQKAVVLRRNADGTLDPSYGVGGVRLFQSAGLDTSVNAVALDSGGRVRAVFTRSTLGGFGVAALTTGGALDDAFTPGGLVFQPFGDPPPSNMQVSSFPDGMAVQSDDNVVETGMALQGGQDVLTVMRFRGPTPDSGTSGSSGGGGQGAGASTPTSQPTTGIAAVAGLGGARISGLRYNGRTIAYTLRCPAGAPGGGCAGTARLTATTTTTKAKLAAHKRKRRTTVAVGATSFSVAAGATVKGTITPTRGGKALLRRHRRVAVSVKLANPATAQSASARATVVRVVTKRKRKRAR
jgi:uncharacterized delta-60 repeat protein